MPVATPTDLTALRARLQTAGQEHLLTFVDRLNEHERGTLLAQIQALDLAGLPRLIDAYVKRKPVAALGSSIEPAPVYALRGGGYDRGAYRARGEALIAAGKVAAFTVAGGQGSRLGYEGPKGCYPAGSVTRKPLFACLAEWILAAQRKWGSGRVIPWYIMTSPINHAATIEFFEQHAYFGLAKRDVMFFPQGVMPALEMGTGRILLDQPGALALSPDGHGGSLRALHASGALADMRSRGIEHVSYTQIDNPLVRVIDPVFIGLHAFAPDSSAQMSSKMVVKAHAGERVGVFAKVDGRTQVVEYSDLPEELAKATTAGGALKFAAGSIAVHMIGLAFLEALNRGGGGFSLPYHRAEKKVPFIDLQSGRRVEPTANNAVKLETFVFDALALCERSIVVETDRVEEFAPIKNAEGADSPSTCSATQTRRAARWLEGAGCRVPLTPAGEADCVIEISPLRAMEPADLQDGRAPRAIPPGSSVAL